MAFISKQSLGINHILSWILYSGKPDIEGKNLKKHIAISSEPANILAIEYTGLEVRSNSNNKALSLKCTYYPFIVKALGKKQVRKK